MKLGAKMITALLATALCVSACVVEDDDETTIVSSSDTVATAATGSTFSPANKIYIDLTNAQVSADNENWSDITTTSTDFFDETVKVKYTETDAGASTGVIRVDAEDATATLGVILSGTQTTGGVKIQTTTDYEVGVYLNDVSITSTNYPCIDITKGGAASVFVTGTNTLTDGRTYSTDYSSYSDNKGTLYCKGGMALVAPDGTGSLSITQNYKSCIATKANLSIESGTYTLTSTAVAVYDSSDGDYNSPACINVDGNVAVSGGTVTGTASGDGSKAITVDGTYTQSAGTVNVKATGSNIGSSSSARAGFPGSSGGSSGPGGGSSGTNPGSSTGTNTDSSSSSGSASASAKGVKIDGAIMISGGTLYARSTSDEALESKSTITISGGEVLGYSTADDGINAASDLTISGGYVCGYSSANDGIDANGNMYIKGGVVYAVCAKSPEVALDANTEQQKKLHISGGTIMTLGPLESGASLTQDCYKASSWSANTNYGLKAGDTTYVFKTPSTTSGYGSGIVVSYASKPTLTSGATTSGGTSYFDGLLYVGGTAGSTSVSLSSYTN